MSDPALIRDPIIEAAARALEDRWNNNRPTGAEPFPLSTGEALQAVLAAVTPMIEDAYVRSRATIHVAAIRAAALEQAAQVAEEQPYYPDTNIGMRQQWVKDQIATKIRALKEQP
jgi:hypothetical protein